MQIEFGKYKGREVDVLEDDLSYAKWILDQEWVKQKYPKFYEVVEELYKEESKNIAQNSLKAKENFLISMDLKSEKIENFDEYPLCLPVVKNLQRTLFHPNVTFIIGENGSGKSTLLEALAITQDFNPEGGSVNFSFSTRESHSNLHEYLRIAKSFKRPKTGFFLRAESFFNVATEIENIGDGIIKSYGGKSLHEKSHGEAFFSLMQYRFGAEGLYILDEPESALSPNRQMSMLSQIHQLVLEGSQFIIATHSPILLAYPNATIYEIQDGHLNKCLYEESETFRISKDFLNDPKRFLQILLD